MRRNQYSSEKRRKELDRKKKQEEKRQKKLDRRVMGPNGELIDPPDLNAPFLEEPAAAGDEAGEEPTTGTTEATETKPEN